MRKAAFVASLLVVLAALVIVPMPLVALSPGPAIDVPTHLRVARTAGRVRGKLLLLTVTLGTPSVAGAAVAWLDPHRELLRRSAVIPQGENADEYFRSQEAVFRESVRVAAAVALRAAGQSVTVTGGGARIAAVVKGGPAAGVLQVGDVVTGAGDKRVLLATDLVTATEAAARGQRLQLTVQRAGRTLHLSIVPRQVTAIGRVGIGVALDSVAPDIRLPFAVRLTETDIGGPSAGLMLALSIYDLVSEVDLAHGRVVAGTGTIDIDGTIGPIGGIAEKVVAAERAGAEVFLAPASQAAAARKAAGKRLHVVSVGDFTDALDALRGGLR